MIQPSFGDYLAYLLRPFFRAWWAAITGFASVLALFLARESTIAVGGPGIAIAVLLLFSLSFVILAAVSQGWVLYKSQAQTMRVISFEKTKEVAGGWVLIVEAQADIGIGATLDIHKRSGVAEVPLALVEIVGRNSDGAYQARTIGKINPVHIREHANGGLRPTDLVVRPFVKWTRIAEVNRDL